MQVINSEFQQNVLTQLNSLPAGMYLTRDQLCERAGVDTKWSLVISLMMQDAEFAGFECVKSKGIRKKK